MSAKFKPFIELINSSIVSIVISILALCISLLTYCDNKKRIDHDIWKDTMLMTPALIENIESEEIIYSLNKENAILQALCITFPEEVWENTIISSTTPVKINKCLFEQIARRYADEKFEKKDSTCWVGTIVIPVVIDYNAIIGGFNQNLRENRAFIFESCIDNNSTKISYSNSVLLNRLGYPLETHYINRFQTDIDKQNTILKLDKKDVLELLNEELSEFMK